MFKAINHYFSFQGLKYVRPDKAGTEAEAMETFKKCGQAARLEMTRLSNALATHLKDFQMGRVSNWSNQAQMARPHFWTYFHGLSDNADDVGMAIRFYGEQDNFGISVEVSFIERHRSDDSLNKQARVLHLPIKAPLYYWVQSNDGHSHREEGTEDNRQRLKIALEKGDSRKVIVKIDIPLTVDSSIEEVLPQILDGFNTLYPYYLETKNDGAKSSG